MVTYAKRRGPKRRILGAPRILLSKESKELLGRMKPSPKGFYFNDIYADLDVEICNRPRSPNNNEQPKPTSSTVAPSPPCCSSINSSSGNITLAAPTRDVSAMVTDCCIRSSPRQRSKNSKSKPECMAIDDDVGMNLVSLQAIQQSTRADGNHVNSTGRLRIW